MAQTKTGVIVTTHTRAANGGPTIKSATATNIATRRLCG
jgi:hypothetical protein